MSEKDVGFIRQIGGVAGHGRQAVCSRHAKCICWVTPRVAFSADALASELLLWLAENLGATRGEHLASAKRLKEAYGMKPKT